MTMSSSLEENPETRKKISIKKPVPKSDANVAGDLRLEITANSKKRKGQQDEVIDFDSSKVESPFLDSRIIERKKERERRKAVAGSS